MSELSLLSPLRRSMPLLALVLAVGCGGDGADGINGNDGDPGEPGDPGIDGTNALVSTTSLDRGDANCPHGGVQLDTGLDNGDGGGTAGDGVLQTGEIDSTHYVCDGAPVLIVEDITPPTGPVGTATIDASGGEGYGAEGGSGGYMDVEFLNGSRGGHIKFFATGEADASFTFPASVSTYMGLNPLMVTGDLTVKAKNVGDHTGLATGEAHTHQEVDALFSWDGATDSEITGIDVAAAATLTFEPHHSAGVFLRFDNDVHLAGSLTTTYVGADRPGVYLDVDTFHSEVGSVIDLTGSDASGGNNGGQGGLLTLDCQDGNWSTTQSAGSVYLAGTIDTSGGDGDVGGDAGPILIYGNLTAQNTGTITARGGKGSVAGGGNGAQVYLDAEYGNLLNSGDIDSSGGAGTSFGGNAGSAYFYIGYEGDMRNSGTLTAEGGDGGTDCASSCNGGAGGFVTFYQYAGLVSSSGDLQLGGGDGGTSGWGGGGGHLTARTSYESGWIAQYLPSGDIEISGNIDLSGGSGRTGGSGGYVDIDADAEYVADNQEIIFYGFTDFLLGGGDGATTAGDGGSFLAENNYGYDEVGYYLPGGGVINYTNIDVSGADGGANGGWAGDIELRTATYYGHVTDGMVIVNHGDLDVSGGDGGTADAGTAGGIRLWGFDGVENHGDIDAFGGAGYNGGYGTDSGEIYGVYLISDQGPTINTGDVDVSGGAATNSSGWGGEAGAIEMVGRSLDNAGDLHADGGDHPNGGGGGNGSSIFLYGLLDGCVNTGASLTVEPGTGTPDGTPGEVFIDGMNVTDDWYTP